MLPALITQYGLRDQPFWKMQSRTQSRELKDTYDLIDPETNSEVRPFVILQKKHLQKLKCALRRVFREKVTLKS